MDWKSRIRNRKPLLGVEVDAPALKLVALERRRGGLRARRVELETMPPEALRTGQIADPEPLAEGLQRLLGGEAAHRVRCASAVGGEAVMIQTIKLPAETGRKPKQWKEAARAAAANSIPFAGEVNLDCDLLPGDAGEALAVLAVAAKQESVNNLVEAFGLAGYWLSDVDATALALQNCYEYNYQPAEDAGALLLHIGTTLTHCSLLRGATPVVTRSLSIGAQTAHVSASAAAPPPARVLCLEIRRTLDSLESGGAAPQTVYLAGEHAAMPGLREELQRELQLPVEELDPFRRLGAETAELPELASGPQKSRFAVAAGLALRGWA